MKKNLIINNLSFIQIVYFFLFCIQFYIFVLILKKIYLNNVNIFYLSILSINSFFLFSNFFFFINKKFRKIYLINLSLIIIPLFLVELSLELKRSYFKHTHFYEWKIESKKYLFEEKYPSLLGSYFKSLNKQNTKQIIPLAGISNTFTIHCNESGYWSNYKSDQNGFNNSKQIQNDRFDVLLLGDSFIHGACVNYENTIVGNLNQNIKAYSLGYDGFGPLRNYAALVEYGLHKKPKNVFFFFYEENDLQGLAKEMDYKTLQNYLKNENFSQNLIYKQKLIDENLKKFFKKEVLNKEKFVKSFKIKRILKLNNIREIINFRNAPQIESVNSENLKILINILKLTEKKLNRINSKLFFVYLPTYNRYMAKENDNYKLFKKQIKDEVTKNNFIFIDIDKEFKKTNLDPKEFYPNGRYGHYNEDGYKFISNIIIKLINN